MLNMSNETVSEIEKRLNVDSLNCEVCKKSYISKSQLKVHKRFHTGEGPYKCEICDKNFTVKSKLTRHMLVHIGKKDFQCHVCGN